MPFDKLKCLQRGNASNDLQVLFDIFLVFHLALRLDWQRFCFVFVFHFCPHFFEALSDIRNKVDVPYS